MHKTHRDHYGIRVILIDSISYLDAAGPGVIIVSASHGGVSSARCALNQPLAVVVFNAVGSGKDVVGIAGLALLYAVSGSALAGAHTSARIGEAEDTWACGVLSAVNQTVGVAGLQPGMSVQGGGGPVGVRSKLRVADSLGEQESSLLPSVLVV